MNCKNRNKKYSKVVFIHKEFINLQDPFTKINIYYFQIDNNIENINNIPNIGTLDCVLDIESNSAFIRGMSINPQYRYQGFGTRLLLFVLDDLKKCGTTVVELDDMSDNYSKPNNIYLKCGFHYIDVGSGPEMILHLT